MSSSEEKLSVADIYEAFHRVREENPYLFPKALVITPESILGEMHRKGVVSWDQIQTFDHLNPEGLSRVGQLVCVELKKELEGNT